MSELLKEFEDDMRRERAENRYGGGRVADQLCRYPGEAEHG